MCEREQNKTIRCTFAKSLVNTILLTLFFSLEEEEEEEEEEGRVVFFTRERKPDF